MQTAPKAPLLLRLVSLHESSEEMSTDFKLTKIVWMSSDRHGAVDDLKVEFYPAFKLHRSALIQNDEATKESSNQNTMPAKQNIGEKSAKTSTSSSLKLQEEE